jgi:flagellar assembly protein FliH
MSNPTRPRVISSAGAERWALPSVDGPILGGRKPEEEAKRAQVVIEQREASRAKGYEEGLAAAKAETDAKLAQLDARARRLDAILQFLSRPLEQLDDEVERQLTTLALTVGKQIARRELKADPTQVIAIIREAVARLPASARDVRVHLHPDDAAIVRERLAATTSERAWSVVEDPALSQGGCMVRTDTSQIDQRLESRLNAIVASILGDERAAARVAAANEESAPEAPAQDEPA